LRQLELGGECGLLGNARLGSAIPILRPFLRQIQGAVDKRRPVPRCVREEDTDLAVHGVARRARVLACDAAGLPPLLQEAGLVHDEDAGGGIPEMVDHVVPQVIADAVGVPGGGAQQALHPARPELADRFGELPTILALHPPQ
jgi:hypothetical protein